MLVTAGIHAASPKYVTAADNKRLAFPNKLGVVVQLVSISYFTSLITNTVNVYICIDMKLSVAYHLIYLVARYHEDRIFLLLEDIVILHLRLKI